MWRSWAQVYTHVCFWGQGGKGVCLIGSSRDLPGLQAHTSRGKNWQELEYVYANPFSCLYIDHQPLFHPRIWLLCSLQYVIRHALRAKLEERQLVVSTTFYSDHRTNQWMNDVEKWLLYMSFRLSKFYLSSYWIKLASRLWKPHIGEMF